MAWGCRGEMPDVIFGDPRPCGFDFPAAPLTENVVEFSCCVYERLGGFRSSMGSSERWICLASCVSHTPAAGTGDLLAAFACGAILADTCCDMPYHLTLDTTLASQSQIQRVEQ